MAVRHRPKPLPPRFRLAGALTAHAHHLVALARRTVSPCKPLLPSAPGRPDGGLARRDEVAAGRRDQARGPLTTKLLKLLTVKRSSAPFARLRPLAGAGPLPRPAFAGG